MKRNRLFIIAAALVLLAAPAAFAQAADAQGQPGGPFLKCLSVVGLTDAQKADIKTLLEAEKPVLQQLGATLKADAQALHAAMQGTDACAIGNAVLKVKADKEAIRAELEKLRTAVEALLTAEQKAKLEGCLAAPHHASQAIVADPIGLD